jgi:N-acetylglucosaminyldiphosphoundecaprenol N-acetyl-beta-D-mannosaminyltransferase
MKDLGKRNILGVMIDVVDYEAAVDRILQAAQERLPFAAAALAVHGVMTGAEDPSHGRRLNSLDLATPDGQPVRWALNLLHRTQLRERVYGPQLMLRVCERAADERIPIFLYGGHRAVLERLERSLMARFPGLQIAGAEPSLFRRTTIAEKRSIAARIRHSGAGVVFVGLGCPRQEVFVYEYRDAVGVPLIAVGAAFEYLAGIKREPPLLLQRLGFQWLHRLVQDPRRLWKRYTSVSARYVYLVCLQFSGWRRFQPATVGPPIEEVSYG